MQHCPTPHGDASRSPRGGDPITPEQGQLLKGQSTGGVVYTNKAGLRGSWEELTLKGSTPQRGLEAAPIHVPESAWQLI